MASLLEASASDLVCPLFLSTLVTTAPASRTFRHTGGAFSYYANVHVTDLLTTWRTLLLSMFTGLWIAGGIVLCVVQILYFYADVSRRTSMIVIDCICFAIYFFSVVLICLQHITNDSTLTNT